MRQSLLFVSLIGFGLALPATQAQAKCGGLKSATCHCRATAEGHSITGNPAPGTYNLVDLKGTPLFTYTLPGKCFNPQVDRLMAHFGRGCWKACRDAVGVEGATPDPGLNAMKAAAGKFIRSRGGCGGWYNAVYEYAAGTNKFRSATANTIGIGVGGSLRVDPRTGAKVCR